MAAWKGLQACVIIEAKQELALLLSAQKQTQIVESKSPLTPLLVDESLHYCSWEERNDDLKTNSAKQEHSPIISILEDDCLTENQPSEMVTTFISNPFEEDDGLVDSEEEEEDNRAIRNKKRHKQIEIDSDEDVFLLPKNSSLLRKKTNVKPSSTKRSEAKFMEPSRSESVVQDWKKILNGNVVDISSEKKHDSKRSVKKRAKNEDANKLNTSCGLGKKIIVFAHHQVNFIIDTCSINHLTTRM